MTIIRLESLDTRRNYIVTYLNMYEIVQNCMRNIIDIYTSFKMIKVDMFI